MTANALSALSGPPPAPNPQPTQGMQPNALSGAPGAPAGAAPGMPPAAAAIQAPSHQQTVVALRHFDAIERQLSSALQDSDVGKADMKSKVIDGATKLVATGIMTPAQAVSMLGTFPERPYDQKTWLQQHLQQTVQAATAVLSHHQAAFAGQPVDATPPDPDDHSNSVSGLMGQYKGAAPNG